MGSKGFIGKGINGECRILSNLDLTDIRFVDFGKNLFFVVSAMRMMTVGLLLPCTAMVPTGLGSPTTTPDMGAVIVVSARSDSAADNVDTAVLYSYSALSMACFVPAPCS